MDFGHAARRLDLGHDAHGCPGLFRRFRHLAVQEVPVRRSREGFERASPAHLIDPPRHIRRAASGQIPDACPFGPGC